MLKSPLEMSVEELELEITRHNHLYFKDHAPEISDETYDQLVLLLKERAPDSAILHTVGSDLSDFDQKVEHNSPMLSLDKCYLVEELLAWAGKIKGDLIISPKMDGVALALFYDSQGHLKRAATRGDGHKGEDVTANIFQVLEIPKKISKGPLEVRGEIYMKNSVFEKKGGEFKSPRNLTAGAIKQKDPNKTADFQLSFAAYELLGIDFSKELEKFEQLRTLDLTPVPYEVVPNIKKDLEEAYLKYFSLRQKLDFEIDGVVYRANLISEQIRLGASNHHPRWAMAYKFQGQSKGTVLREICWNVSRTGSINPVAIVDPVFLSGASVSKISLHHAGRVRSQGLSVGARVLVERRGGVIPYLDQVLEKGSGKVEIPSKCPSCGAGVLEKNDFLYCKNKERCRGVRVAFLEYFIKVMDVEELGSKLVAQLYDHGMLRRPSDFFKLKKEKLLQLERMGEILAEKILKNIERARKVDLETFLQSLGIEDLAKNSSKLLVKHFGILEKLMEAGSQEIETIAGIGPITAKNTVEGLKEQREEILLLLKEVTLKEKEKAKGRLGGKTFLFTGKMSAMSRQEAQEKVMEAGGEVSSTVSKNLDFLVIGSEGYRKRDKGNKWIRAEALISKGAKIQIISEEDFLGLLDK